MEFWDLCITNCVFPGATHTPGIQDTIADHLSQEINITHEWSLSSHFLNPIFCHWGLPDIDMFANRSNSKCQHYNSKEGMDPLSLGDGLHIN